MLIWSFGPCFGPFFGLKRFFTTVFYFRHWILEINRFRSQIRNYINPVRIFKKHFLYRSGIVTVTLCVLVSILLGKKKKLIIILVLTFKNIEKPFIFHFRMWRLPISDWYVIKIVEFGVPRRQGFSCTPLQFTHSR